MQNLNKILLEKFNLLNINMNNSKLIFENTSTIPSNETNENDPNSITVCKYIKDVYENLKKMWWNRGELFKAINIKTPTPFIIKNRIINSIALLIIDKLILLVLDDFKDTNQINNNPRQNVQNNDNQLTLNTTLNKINIYGLQEKFKNACTKLLQIKLEDYLPAEFNKQLLANIDISKLGKNLTWEELLKVSINNVANSLATLLQLGKNAYIENGGESYREEISKYSKTVHILTNQNQKCIISNDSILEFETGFENCLSTKIQDKENVKEICNALRTHIEAINHCYDYICKTFDMYIPVSDTYINELSDSIKKFNEEIEKNEKIKDCVDKCLETKICEKCVHTINDLLNNRESICNNIRYINNEFKRYRQIDLDSIKNIEYTTKYAIGDIEKYNKAVKALNKQTAGNEVDNIRASQDDTNLQKTTRSKTTSNNDANLTQNNQTAGSKVDNTKASQDNKKLQKTTRSKTTSNNDANLTQDKQTARNKADNTQASQDDKNLNDTYNNILNNIKNNESIEKNIKTLKNQLENTNIEKDSQKNIVNAFKKLNNINTSNTHTEKSVGKFIDYETKRYKTIQESGEYIKNICDKKTKENIDKLLKDKIKNSLKNESNDYFENRFNTILEAFNNIEKIDSDSIEKFDKDIFKPFYDDIGLNEMAKNKYEKFKNYAKLGIVNITDIRVACISLYNIIQSLLNNDPTEEESNLDNICFALANLADYRDGTFYEKIKDVVGKIANKYGVTTQDLILKTDKIFPILGTKNLSEIYNGYELNTSNNTPEYDLVINNKIKSIILNAKNSNPKFVKIYHECINDLILFSRIINHRDVIPDSLINNFNKRLLELKNLAGNNKQQLNVVVFIYIVFFEIQKKNTDIKSVSNTALENEYPTEVVACIKSIINLYKLLVANGYNNADDLKYIINLINNIYKNNPKIHLGIFIIYDRCISGLYDIYNQIIKGETINNEYIRYIENCISIWENSKVKSKEFVELFDFIKNQLRFVKNTIINEIKNLRVNKNKHIQIRK